MPEEQSIIYKNYFERMPIPRFIVRMDGAGNYIVVEANQLALRYFDLSAEQVFNQPISNFMSHDNALHFKQSFEVCFSRKQSVTIQALPGVPGSVRVHGFYVSPVKDDDGNIVFLDVIGQLDVADQSILQRE
jgi:PAS domain-containing protein